MWNLAAKIYSRSGHKVELSIVRDVVDSRIEAIKYQFTEQKAQQAAEEARLRIEIASTLAELGGNEIKAQILIRLRKVISEQLNVDKSEIALDSHISHDLGSDELDTVELAMALEEEFEIEISEDLLGSFQEWPSSYSSNSFGNSVPVACTIRELLVFIHKKASN